jgi:hypothetical protein
MLASPGQRKGRGLSSLGGWEPATEVCDCPVSCLLLLLWGHSFYMSMPNLVGKLPDTCLFLSPPCLPFPSCHALCLSIHSLLFGETQVTGIWNVLIKLASPQLKSMACHLGALGFRKCSIILLTECLKSELDALQRASLGNKTLAFNSNATRWSSVEGWAKGPCPSLSESGNYRNKIPERLSSWRQIWKVLLTFHVWLDLQISQNLLCFPH